MSRKELEPGDIVCITDSREQLPLELELKTIRGTLQTGDYSIQGLQHLIALERKSLDDLLMCVGVERERFEREIQRLLAYPARAIIVEASWRKLEQGGWRSRVTPAAALGSVIGWIAVGIPIIMAHDREFAAKMASRFLFSAARKRFRELQSFHSELKIVS